jgi:diguanylate cyclase (GGDEF)-like protein
VGDPVAPVTEGLAGRGRRPRLPLRARRQLAGPALGALYLAGGVLGLSSVALPHGAGVDAAVSAPLAAAGLPVGLVLVRLGRHLRTPALALLLAAGTGMVSLGVAMGHGGGTAVAAAFFYVWVAMYAGAFFPPALAAVEVGLAAGAYAAVAALTGRDGAPAQWVLVTGTAFTAWLVVSRLVGELERVALTDELTGLPNRAGLEALLAREVARAERHRRPLSVAVIDLDAFKDVNDALGHGAGDVVLAELARAWRADLRQVDVLARYGGDEFVAVLPDAAPAQAAAVLGRLSVVRRQQFSVGIAGHRLGEGPAELLDRADRALYEAKRAGRGRIVAEPPPAPTGAALPA